MKINNYLNVEKRVLEIRNLKVLLDSDVAELYGVETKQLNQAVSRNLDKFPEGYILELTENEKNEVVTNCDHLSKLRFSHKLPKAFTERGLYMLATILKSHSAVKATIEIIETFVKLREVKQIISQLPSTENNSDKQHRFLQKAGDIIHELLEPDNVEAEASIELNLAVVKLKYSVKKTS